MNRPLLLAAILIFAAVAYAWHRAGRPRRERLKGKKRLSLKERAQMRNIRLGYETTEAPDADYEDWGQP